jgi:hypothetical protein
MKSKVLGKVTVAILFMIAFASFSNAQRERIGSDASRSIRSRDDRPEQSTPARQSSQVSASQFSRLNAIRPNSLSIDGTSSTDPPVVQICAKYQGEFLPMLEVPTFAEKHVDRGPEELAIAYFLFSDNPKVREHYKTGMDLYVERTKVIPRSRSYVQILVETGVLEKPAAKEAVSSAERKLGGH